MTRLKDLRTKLDGLLENIFNDEYGSELEMKLELESEQLLQVIKGETSGATMLGCVGFQ